ncbi:MAG: hypothetical protein COA78_18275 [Blastopirellula sp.]|nr:MAG: hypothetical protein COA78_18275 [Blastopirellula sp.]
MLAVAFVALFAVSGLNAEEVKSGLKIGASPAAFYVNDVTGPAKGTSLCYRCRYGARPTVAIFARELTDEVKDLIKKIDSTVVANSDQKLAAFVVILSDSPEAQKSSLAKLAASAKIDSTPLTVYKDSKGPAKYKVSEKAAVNVMMWNGIAGGVAVNHAFSTSELTKKQIAAIVKDTGKILE